MGRHFPRCFSGRAQRNRRIESYVLCNALLSVLENQGQSQTLKASLVKDLSTEFLSGTQKRSLIGKTPVTSESERSPSPGVTEER